MYRLLCNADPRALGIETPEGHWDLDRLVAHQAGCVVCGAGQAAITEAVRERLSPDAEAQDEEGQ